MSKDTKTVKEITKFADITDAMKAEWRERYSGATVLEAPVDFHEKDLDPEEWSETARFVLRPLNRSEIRVIESYAAKKDTERFSKFLQKNCILGGDMELFESNDLVYRTVTDACAEMLKSSKKRTAKL